MNLYRFFFIGLLGVSIFFSGCAASPPPTRSKSPAPVYDEEGRPLWVPLPEDRPRSRRDLPPREIPLEETDREQEIRADHPSPPPRIGSAGPPETAPADDNLIAAVSSLEDQAERELSTGQVDRAFSTAERAIRINPRNAELWSLLARIQMERSNYVQAEQLARKSNLMSRGDRALQARNWRIISDSLGERGETEEAKEALRKAWELE